MAQHPEGGNFFPLPFLRASVDGGGAFSPIILPHNLIRSVQFLQAKRRLAFEFQFFSNDEQEFCCDWAFTIDFVLVVVQCFSA